MSQSDISLTDLQLAVIEVLAVHAPATDREVTDAYYDRVGERKSLPSIKTVLKRLRVRGLVELCESNGGYNSSGTYRLTERGEMVVE